MTIEKIYELFRQHPFITTDSRQQVAEGLFFALKGENFDANKFAKQALENGANYAIIDDEVYAEDSRYIVVEDTLVTLQHLATHHRRHLATPIVAITGTNGKTTTKELMASVLMKKYNCLYTSGNLNNHIGVPLTLLRMTPQTGVAVVEMGANHINEIAHLAEIAQPNMGLITNVGKAHLEGFGSFQGVQEAKAELYAYLSKSGGIIFINEDNRLLQTMYEKATESQQPKTAYYTLQNGAKSSCKGVLLSANPFLSVGVETAEGEFIVKSQLVGSYNAENMLAAVLVGSFFGVSNEDMRVALSDYSPSNKRSQLTKTDQNNLYIDTYNANPTSMQAAIENFAQLPLPNKVLILGDMLELGEYAQEEHQKIVAQLEAMKLTNVMLVGEHFAETQHHFIAYNNKNEVIAHLERTPISNANILIKASNGINLDKIIEYL